MCSSDLWADRASVELIGRLLERRTESALVLLAFARPEVATRFANLWRGVARTELKLSPLSERAGETLVSAALELDATVRTAPAAGDATTTIPIGFNGTTVARFQARIVRRQRHDFDAQFMPENARIGKVGLVTLEGVNVGAADANATDPHHGLAW